MERKKGLAFHVHENILAEYCFDYDERIRSIGNFPPKSIKQELWLELFRLIPKDRVPQKGLDTYIQVAATCEKAKVAYDKAWATYHKAFDAWHEAQATSSKARDAYVEANKDEIAALHVELCPGCPWDGKTIYNRRECPTCGYCRLLNKRKVVASYT